MAKKKMYSFTEKKHSQRGITSTVLGTLSLILFCVLSYIAFFMEGQGGPYLGAIGMSAFFLAAAGFIVGMLSFREKHILHFFSKLGSILNAAILVVWIFVILIGIS